MGDGKYLELLSEFYIDGVDVFIVIADLQKVNYVYLITYLYIYMYSFFQKRFRDLIENKNASGAVLEEAIVNGKYPAGGRPQVLLLTYP